MANTVTEVLPKLLAQGLLALRENAVMARLVNRSYENIAAEQGDTVTIPIPSAITAQAVVPSNTPPATADIAPTSVAIPLSEWYEAPFYLTDKEMKEVMNGTIPMQASEAVKAIANNVDNAILAQYTKVYGLHGTPGTTPFASDTSDASGIRKVLNNQLAPLDPRFLVLDAEAEANALDLRAFQDGSYSGSYDEIMNGNLNRKLGFNIFMDQNVPVHVSGAASGYLVNGTPSVGDTTIPIDTGTGAFNVGDIITFAGHTQTYTVVSSVGGASATSVTVSPALQAAPANNAALAFNADHTVNLAFHRDAFALVMRPLADSEGLGTGRIVQARDRVSGLGMRLEVTREHKRTRFSYDVLYGVQTVRAQLAGRLAG